MDEYTRKKEGSGGTGMNPGATPACTQCTGHVGRPYNWRLLPVLFGGLFALLAAWCAGRAVCRRNPEWPWPIVFGLGCAALSTALFFLHLAGGVNRWTLGALGLLAVAAGRRMPVFRLPSRAWLAGLPFLVLYLIHALAPEIQPDAITYHLGLVAEWNREGGFVDRVGFYEMLPQGVEMLYSMAFAYGAHSAAKLVHLAFVIASAALMAETARRLGLGNGICAALLYGCAPVVGVCGSSAYNDAALAFFVLAAFYSVWMWSREGSAEWLIAAGALAGFCYAVKLPGIVAAPAVIAWLLLRRRMREALVVALAAAAVGGPWMLRTWAISGNPVAPLFNRWFENPHFHTSTEEGLTHYLRTYNVSAWQLPIEVTVGGSVTGGLAGPVFLLAPLALLSLRRREGRWLLVAFAIAAIPFVMNAGTRFLMPALAFLALAMMTALPRAVAWGLVAVQMIGAWPHVMDLWAREGAWRLHGVPWQAALRLESDEDYLHRELWEYRVADLLRRYTRRGDRVLDLEVAPPSAYFDATALTPWQSAPADRAADALRVASASESTSYWEGTARWKREAVHAVRVRLATPHSQWSIQEIALLDQGKAVFPSARWALDASPNVWEAPLAFDRNPVSRWRPWREARPGDFVAVHLPDALPLDAARVVLFQPEAGTTVALDTLAPDGLTWNTMSAEISWRGAPMLSHRRRATSLIQREGFRWILARPGSEGLGRIARDLLDRPGDWGLRKVGNVDDVYLLRPE